MAQDLRHLHIYVLELKRIVTPAKARLAFLSNLNRCDKFHFYCKSCGVKLIGKNITKTVIEENQQQPSCSDWRGIKHKPNCASLQTKKPTSGTGGTKGGGGIPISDEIFIPEYLTFERPKFIITEQRHIPDEIDINTLNNAPIDFDIKELKNQNATYLLDDVVNAYNWILDKKIKDEDCPKITLGNKGYKNSYNKLIRPIKNLIYSGNPVVYTDNFELQYTIINDQLISLFSETKISTNIDDKRISSRLNIIIDRNLCINTPLEKVIDSLAKEKADRKNVISTFYIVGHQLPNPDIKISRAGNEYYEYVINVMNPYLVTIIRQLNLSK